MHCSGGQKHNALDPPTFEGLHRSIAVECIGLYDNGLISPHPSRELRDHLSPYLCLGYQHLLNAQSDNVARSLLMGFLERCASHAEMECQEAGGLRLGFLENELVLWLTRSVLLLLSNGKPGYMAAASGISFRRGSPTLQDGSRACLLTETFVFLPRRNANPARAS